jgi:hypothetical protein
MVTTQSNGWCPWGMTPFTVDDYAKAKLGFLGQDNTLYDRQ